MKDTLNARFRAPLKEYYRRRIIVWRDEAGEFAETVAGMQLENARILTMKSDAMFELRRQIEVDYADENLLIYCPMTFERPQDNWLLDVFLYSEEFRADYWSLVFEELNIENTRSAREYAKSVAAFFASRERRARLRALRGRYADERELRTGVLCVLCGAKEFGFAYAVRAVLTRDGEENPALNAMEKFCGEDAFWQACAEEYGYDGTHESLQLACHLLVSASLNGAEDSVLPGLPADAAHALKAYGFFADWLRTDREGLAALCQRVEEHFSVGNLLRRLSSEALLRMGVFPAADRLLLEAALTAFAENRLNPDEAQAMLRARSDSAWAADYAPYFDAVRSLIDMQRFSLARMDGFHYASPKELWNAYGRELYRMDQHYRAFCGAHDRALALGAMSLEDALKAAADAAERLYKNGFLSELNRTWTRLLGEQGLAALTDVPRQQDFYRRNVAPAENRVYVIVSDGLRYEVARELADRMTGKLSGNTECAAMVGLLPGVTPVGMAALLPHRKLEMDDGLKIRCDGMSTDASNRGNVLRAACAESIAVDYAEFRQCSKAQRGEMVKGKRVVYIYHDAIDRAGEGDGYVVQACETAIQELTQLVRILTGELNAASVWIVADHGFLYTRSPMEEYEKTGREILSGEILEYKRRYAIVRGSVGDAQSVSIAMDALGRPELTAAFPMGCTRFRMQGGDAGYMHGGIALQEMMVPLIRHQNRRTGQKGFSAIAKVELELLGADRRISNNFFTLSFYQKQPCGGKLQPRTVLARFEDAAGRAVSDEHRLVCDLIAAENDQRMLRTTFRLLGSGYDHNAQYDLVLRDEADKTEIARIPYQINIVFEDDFGL